MPLDIASHLTELDRLTEALDTVAQRQITPKDQCFFLNHKATAVQLKTSLKNLREWDPEKALKMRSQADQLSGVCGALADHTSSTLGKRFWENQEALLLGLGDYLQIGLRKALQRDQNLAFDFS